MKTSGIQLALWLAYRISRFIFLLCAVLIGISAVLPDFISGRDGCHYRLEFGSVWRISGFRCGYREEVINLWFLFVPAAMSSIYVCIVHVLLSIEEAYGVCDACGYNLTGNVSGRCPECGTPIASL